MDVTSKGALPPVQDLFTMTQVRGFAGAKGELIFVLGEPGLYAKLLHRVCRVYGFQLHATGAGRP